VFSFDVTAWGWIHLLIGLVLVASGFGVFVGSVLARSVGVFVAGLSAVANFSFDLGWNQPFLLALDCDRRGEQVHAERSGYLLPSSEREEGG
jgi:hypothetical protein